MLPAQFKDFSQTIFAVGVFASNILFSYKHGYFSETAVDEKPFLHTWSLGVEEQYYMLFPLVLMLLWRFGRNRVLYIVVITAIISLLVSEWGWRHEPNYNFYLITSRAWELFAGSICAFSQLGSTQKRSNRLSTLGLILIAISIFYFDEATPFPSVYTLVPVIGTCLIVLYGGDRTYVSRLLSTRAFVGIGLISYSAYLWHQPLFAFARIKSLYPPEQWVMALLSGLSFLLAYGSWKFVETPFRRKNHPLAETPKQILAVSAIVMSGIMAFGLYGHLTNGKVNLW
jgi:peptidoglycan/LPS O-acetylase OafA/YrhL